MKPGLYEQLVTVGLTETLEASAYESERDAAGETAPQVLARHLFDAMFKVLA